MPLSELELKWDGMCFESACEEMRRLKGEPKEEEKLVLYGLYKQAIHGDIPEEKMYLMKTCAAVYAQSEGAEFIQCVSAVPSDEEKLKKYNAWKAQKGKSEDICRSEYVQLAEAMIRQYKRKIVRCKWNSEVWSVDY